MARNKPESLWLPGLEFAEESSPATESHTPDHGERARALDPRQSFIVQAPAGSGKTELLIRRYLNLLARVTEPEQVVAITFTIKAAGEMRSRVLDALRLAGAEPEPARAHERETWQIARRALARNHAGGWRLLENPERMRIQTIDALSMSIARHMPWTARFGAMPRVTEDARPMYRLASENTIRALGGEGVEADAVETLLRHVDNDAGIAVGLIAGMLETRDHWLRVLGAGADPLRVRATLENTLRGIVEEALEAVCACVPESVAHEMAALARFAGANVAPDSPIALCRDLLEPPGNLFTALPHWRGIAEMLLTQKDGWRQQITARLGFAPADRDAKARLQQLLARLRGEEAFRDALARLSTLPSVHFPESQWQVLEAVFRLLPLAVAELRLVFAERGTVDFTEIAQAALRALGTPERPTDLALATGSKIEHLLIDEFQDTSVAQYDLLTALTAGWQEGDGRTIFLVGDPMQSIYRFRQAEVGLFLKARHYGIGNIVPEPLQLTANFRSASNLVDWTNQVFEGAFPASDDMATGAVAYSASVAANISGTERGVFFYPFTSRDDAGEAALTLDLIGAARSSGNCAVLVRARTHLFAIAEELRRRGVPFRAIEIDLLGERPVVQDLWSLTRALLHLADRPAWLAVLRAPWCGLALADLEAIAGADRYATVWDLLFRTGLDLTPDGRERIERVAPILERALGQRGRVAVRRLVESAWAMLDGPACLRGEAELADASTYLDLLDQMEAGGDLADPRAFANRVNELFAKPDPAADASLELMTIHKAKGLEFDTVILPGLGRIPRPEEPKLLLWTERTSSAGAEVLIAPISGRRNEQDPIYAYLSRLDRQKAELESVRLLYVACTRARRSLHLIGHVEGKATQPSRGSLLEPLWAAVRGEFESLTGRATVEANQPAARRARAIRRLSAGWKASEPPQGVVLPPLRAMEQEAAVTFDWAGETLRHIGTVAHRLLARIAREGLASWDAERVLGQRNGIEIALAGLGVPDTELAEACARVIEALRGTLTDPRGRWILDAHEEARSEFALAGVVDGTVQRIAVDRTFVDESGTRWVIDFKTAVHAGGDIDAFIGNERRRYEQQLERYASLIARLDGRPARVGLYFPLLTRWCEWEPAGRVPARSSQTL
jgi:ATP-dependent helicase/nuclease subunit A